MAHGEQKEILSRETICTISQCTQSFASVCVFAADGCAEGSAREREWPGNSHRGAISSKQVAGCPSFSQQTNVSDAAADDNPILTKLHRSD